MWNIKYVSGLKWDDLTAKIGMLRKTMFPLSYVLTHRSTAYQNAVKKQKLRMELEQAARESRAYIDNVKQARVADRIRERKEKIAAAATSADGAVFVSLWFVLCSRRDRCTGGGWRGPDLGGVAASAQAVVQAAHGC
jgi:hypothetical protein